jgi:uroporphyrinogen-III synthase
VGVLAGVRIVVTRAAHQAEELARPLSALGAEVVLLPLIGIAPPADPKALRQAARHANDYDWIIFTSANAIHAFAAELPYPVPTCTARIATVGAATRTAAEERGFTVELTPETYVAEALVGAFRSEDLSGKRILIPSAAVTRDVVATELRARGVRVDVVEAYRNVLPPEAATGAAEIFREPYPDWVTFASSSAVDNLLCLIERDNLRNVKIASIGPITSKTVRQYGLEVAAEAREHSIEGLVAAICHRSNPPFAQS